jgi:hypothetical protein
VAVEVEMAEGTLYLAAFLFMVGSISVIVGAFLVDAYPNRRFLYFLPAGGMLLLITSFNLYQKRVEIDKKKALEELKRTKIAEELHAEAKAEQEKCLSQLKECLKESPALEAGKCFGGAEKCCWEFYERFKEETVKTCLAYLESSDPDLLDDAKLDACRLLINAEKPYSACKEKVRKAFLKEVKGGGNERN